MQVPAGPEQVSVLGSGQRNLKMIREGLGVHVVAREGGVRIEGERADVVAARAVLERLGEASAQGREVPRAEVLDLIAEESARARSIPAQSPLPAAEVNGSLGVAWEGPLQVLSAGRPIRPRTPNQEAYVEAIRTHDLVVASGPAGTGKTYLAVAAALHLLRLDRVRKLVLVRPAVEAGEKLGFLPGDLEAKVNPYLRPLFDALNDMVDFATIRRFMASDVVEVVPLAFMRGRTLNHSVIILDEAQNTTSLQMKMFLTRMGHGSKMVVTGDPTQIDLPDPRDSGLIDACRRLARVAGVALVSLDRADVVRHVLVQRIVDAYGPERGGPVR